ncbi:DUF1588 domain-containing protein [Oligoflexus tunisiensis]|uniref:DUF1588 domain-containing protein n=1 Tax=Oligoflexus tunisiensis TaxID=708132 RepID=UPI001C40692A|nr:DUF1588 domain-containing protein [Oligoflexus tunisiensis]
MPPDPVASLTPTPVPALSFQSTKADFRPLSKIEIQNSLQDILRLPEPLELNGFLEQSSKSQIFRNSYNILNDSSSLAGLSRDINALLDNLNWAQLSTASVQCDALASADCRTTLLERLAVHAWRRPLDPAERETLIRQSADISKLPATVQTGALAHIAGQIFFDPRFLFRMELGVDATAPSYALAPWEKLSAISYNLTHRPPTFEQIQTLAEFEDDPTRFAQLIDQLIETPALAASLSGMISQWLMYYGLEGMDVQGDPNWSAQKAKEQLAAAEQFIATTLLQEGTLRSLFTRVNPENNGFGLFASKAFLTSTSKNGQASMIIRGVRIIRNALCQGMGPPPGTLEAAPPKDLSPMDPNYDIKLSLMHGARPACVGCHRLIDPAGLALHAFDGFGVQTDAMVDLSALGIASQVTVALGGQRESIATASAKEFAESIANSTTFARCFSRNALRYILGRDLAEDELATADILAERHLMAQAPDKESLTNFFREIMTSDTVYMRVR